MATRMLWLAKPQRKRLSLRLNDDNRKFYYPMEGPVWVPCDEKVILANGTAAIHFDLSGMRMNVSRVSGFAQLVLLADTTTDRTIGALKVDENGAIAVKDTPILPLMVPTVPTFWSQKVTAIMGVNGLSFDCAQTTPTVQERREG